MNTKRNREAILFGVYAAALLIQNILALKTIDIWVFSMTTGILVSPIVFMAQDVESEIYGYKHARTMILLGYLMNFLFTALVNFAIIITPSIAYGNQEAFSAIFSTTWRITIASFAAYTIGSLMNAKIMTMQKEKHGLFYRAIFSTIVGQFLDNAIFCFGAFLGVLPFNVIAMMVLGATIWEIGYEIILYPLTKKVIEYFKKHE